MADRSVVPDRLQKRDGRSHRQLKIILSTIIWGTILSRGYRLYCSRWWLSIL